MTNQTPRTQSAYLAELRKFLSNVTYQAFLMLRSGDTKISLEENLKNFMLLSDIMHNVPRYLSDDEALARFSIEYFLISPLAHQEDENGLGEFCRDLVSIFQVFQEKFPKEGGNRV